MDLIDFIKSRGWVYSGNCASCDNATLYLNAARPGWRIKMRGNTSGIIQQNQNPINKQDFKNITLFTRQNYEQVFNQYFPA